MIVRKEPCPLITCESCIAIENNLCSLKSLVLEALLIYLAQVSPSEVLRGTRYHFVVKHARKQLVPLSNI